MAIPTQLKIYTTFSRPFNNLKMMLGWVFLYPYPPYIICTKWRLDKYVSLNQHFLRGYHHVCKEK